ncbi:MAG: YceI family protein [Thermoanaerobaculia bacterium]|nr:YceI family protein [Thermoanaerobaculia bacterium]
MSRRSVRRTRVAAAIVGVCILLGMAGGAVGTDRAEETGEAPDGSSEWVFEVDPEASSITFELGATMHTVEGTAEVTGGSVRFDPAEGTASGRIEVSAASLDTGNDSRDEDMHQKVLESERYPEIYFEAEGLSGPFEPRGTSRVTLDGDFGIHGDEHPIRLTFDVRAEGEAVEASTEFRLPYVEWGMNDPSRFLLRVDKHVTVRIDAVGTLSQVAPASVSEEASEEESDSAAEGEADREC